MAAQQHIQTAKRILEQPAEDIGSDEIAEATGHALVAIAEHLGEIANVMARTVSVEIVR